MHNTSYLRESLPIFHYFYLPFAFSQFVAFHIYIGFPVNYIFLLPLVFLVKINISTIFIFIIGFIFLYISAFYSQTEKEGFQIFLDIFFGYLLALFYLQNYSLSALKLFFENLIRYLLIIIIILFIDLYFFGLLNAFFSSLTYFQSGGTSTLLPRISFIFGNPNWFSMFILLISTFLLELKTNKKYILYSLIAIVMLQTTTAIYIYLSLIIVYFLKSSYSNRFIYVLAFIFIGIFAYITFLSNFFLNTYLNELESISYIRREIIYSYLNNKIFFYPSGFFSLADIQILKIYAYEDSIPSILVLLKLFGFIGFFAFVIYILRKNLFSFNLKDFPYVAVTLLGYSITMSFISVSASCALAAFIFFLSDYKRSYTKL